MGKSDEIDRRRAAAYAWRFLAPGAHPEASGWAQLADDPLEPGSSPGDVSDGGEGMTAEELMADLQAHREDALRTCQAMADSIDRVWQLPEGAARATTVATLLARTAELGLGLCAMERHPLQGVRLMRLAVRCQGRLAAQARKHACAASLLLDYKHPEVIELLAEVAHAGDISLASTLFMALRSQARMITGIPGAGARLGRLLGQAQTFRARYIAIMWLDIAAGPQAISPLRTLLRQPHFSLRFRSLRMLNTLFPDAIEPDDVLFLLEDALVRVPPELDQCEENSRANYYFPGELLRAVVGVRPSSGHLPLIRIIDGDCAPRGYRGGLDDAWALGTLAAAYPREALPRIDELMRHAEWHQRDKGATAATRLPDELAWPRLLAAAADSVPEIAETAQQAWLERRKTLCPLDQLAGLEAGLLAGPPSACMGARLTLLRSGSLEARAAMVEVLLGEAPDPEALVLLLFSAADCRLWTREVRPGLPASRAQLCSAIVERFGVVGLQGLCALAARYPEGRRGWLDAMSKLLSDHRELPEAALSLLQAAAARRLTRATRRTEPELLLILHRVGAPPELFERLWQIARDPAQKAYHRRIAAAVLGTIPASDADHDRIIAAEMKAALAASDLPRFARAAPAGLHRGLPEAVAMTQGVLAEYGAARQDDDMAVTDALDVCVQELEQQGGLPAGWPEAALAQPGTQAFAVAARRTWRCVDQVGPATLEALEAALTSASAAAAAEAAIVLSRMREIAADAPVLVDIAGRAPLPLRAELVSRMTFEEVPLRGLWPLVEALLVSPDPTVTGPLCHAMFMLADSGLEDQLHGLGPRIVEPALRISYREWRSTRQDEGDYWQDTAVDLAE